MAKKKTSRRSRFADDAALQALVRYGPEETGLKALAQQARADYGVSVRQAQTTGDLTLAAAKEAIPGVAKIYDSAGLAQARTASLVSPELAALTGPGAATLQRGGALEVAQQLGNLRASKASALEDLTTRQVAARQGQQFGILAARQKFTQDMQKILGQSQGLAQQKGAFTASTLNALEQAALGRSTKKQVARIGASASRANTKARLSQSERNSLRSSGIDPDTGKPIPGGKLDPKKLGTLPGGVKLNTAAMHGRVTDQVKSLEGWIRQHKGDYTSRHEIAQDLLNGVAGQTVTDPKTGAKIRDPGVPKAPSQLALQAALDVVYNGGLSNGTARALHQRGYSVGALGLPSGTKIKPPPKRSRRAAARVPGLGAFGR
jgi:hypothetical protein